MHDGKDLERVSSRPVSDQIRVDGQEQYVGFCVVRPGMPLARHPGKRFAFVQQFASQRCSSRFRQGRERRPTKELTARSLARSRTGRLHLREPLANFAGGNASARVEFSNCPVDLVAHFAPMQQEPGFFVVLRFESTIDDVADVFKDTAGQSLLDEGFDFGCKFDGHKNTLQRGGYPVTSVVQHKGRPVT